MSDLREDEDKPQTFRDFIEGEQPELKREPPQPPVVVEPFQTFRQQQDPGYLTREQLPIDVQEQEARFQEAAARAQVERGLAPFPEGTTTETPMQEMLRAMAASEDPAGEVAKWNAAQYAAQALQIHPSYAYQNLDEIGEALYGRRMAAAPFSALLVGAIENGQKNYELAKLASELKNAGGEDPELFDRIRTLVDSIEPLSEVPRPWVQQALLWAAESAPLMVEAAISGGAAGIAGGLTALLLGPAGIALQAASIAYAVGTTVEMMDVMGGLSYWRMRDQGVSHDVAAPLSDIEGIISGALESAGQAILGFIPGVSGLASRIATKALASGAVVAIGTRVAAGVLVGGAEELVEEGLQELTSIITDEVARELSGPGTTIPERELNEALAQIGEAAFTGLSAGLVFGVAGVPGGVVGTVQQFNAIKETASGSESRAAFVDQTATAGEQADSPEWRTYLGKVWDAEHAATAAEVQAEGTEEQGAEDLVHTPPQIEAELTSRIEALQAKVDEGTITPSEVAELVDTSMSLDQAQEEAPAETQQADITTMSRSEWLARGEEQLTIGIEGEVAQPQSEAVTQRIQESFPNMSEEEVTGASLILDMRAEALDITTDEYVAQTFQEGMFADLETLTPQDAAQDHPAGVKGAVSFAEDGRAIIGLTQTSDFSTFAHESAHIFQRQLDTAQAQVAENHYQVEAGQWSEAQEEAFATDFENYLQDGTAPTPELQTVFQRFAEWMKKIYSTIRGKVTPEIREVFDSLLAKQDSGLADVLYQGDQTATPEFQQWFGDSKVVDEVGEPLVVYHGTTVEFAQFEANPLTRTHEELKDQPGIFFSRNPDSANFYAIEGSSDTGPIGTNPQVLPVFLSIQNPLPVDKSTYPPPTTFPFRYRDDASAEEIFDAIREKAQADFNDGDANGQPYDGIIVQGSGGLIDQIYITFQPTQIKSATGNAGTFDPTNPDIRYQPDSVENVNKFIRDMTADEKDAALLLNPLSGIPNLTAYNEDVAENGGPMPVQASIDADSLKWVNDNLGHPSGDEMLRKIAQALNDQVTDDVRVYHTSGDEFRIQGQDTDTVLDAVNFAEDILNGAIIRVKAGDNTAEMQGFRFSIGVDEKGDFADADGRLAQDKEQREVSGTRSARGEVPPQVVVMDASGNVVSGDDARAFFDDRRREAVQAAETPRATDADPTSPANIERRRAQRRAAAREAQDRRQSDILYQPADQVESEAFKEWFGDSKIVNEDDSPMVVFHGTNADWTVYDPERGGTGGWARGGLIPENAKGEKAVFITTSSEPFAEIYGDVKALYLRAERPIIVDAVAELEAWLKGEKIDQTPQEYIDSLGDFGAAYSLDDRILDLTFAAKDGGFDGFIIKTGALTDPDIGSLGDIVGVFQPNQIKSATENTGAFSLTDPDTRYQPDAHEEAIQTAVETGQWVADDVLADYADREWVQTETQRRDGLRTDAKDSAENSSQDIGTAETDWISFQMATDPEPGSYEYYRNLWVKKAVEQRAPEQIADEWVAEMSPDILKAYLIQAGFQGHVEELQSFDRNAANVATSGRMSDAQYKKILDKIKFDPLTWHDTLSAFIGDDEAIRAMEVAMKAHPELSELAQRKQEIAAYRQNDKEMGKTITDLTRQIKLITKVERDFRLKTEELTQEVRDMRQALVRAPIEARKELRRKLKERREAREYLAKLMKHIMRDPAQTILGEYATLGIG